MGTVANDGVFRFLANAPATARNLPAVATPDDPSRDYYREAGAHPDIVERLWDQLGKNLPASSKALVFGTPALVHQASSSRSHWARNTRCGSLEEFGARSGLTVSEPWHCGHAVTARISSKNAAKSGSLVRLLRTK